MLYTSEGNLRAEDRALRTVARQRVLDALAQLEGETKAIVDALIARLGANVSCKLSADELLDVVENHPRLQPERATIKRYTDAFPELKERSLHTCERINRKTFNRLHDFLAPLEHARRFANTKGAYRH